MIVRLLALFALIVASNAAPKLVMEARLENFYQCPESPKIPIVWSKMLVKRINAKESRLYGDAIFSEDISDIKTSLELFKCASKSEPDTCEYYTSMKLPSLCEKIEKKIPPWYDYWNSTTMPQKCPFGKGNYKVNGVKIGMDSSFPLFDGFWRFKNKGFTPQGKLALCFFMEMNIHRRFKL